MHLARTSGFVPRPQRILDQIVEAKQTIANSGTMRVHLFQRRVAMLVVVMVFLWGIVVVLIIAMAVVAVGGR